MIFIIITFFAAFLIEALGSAVSIIGLSSLFGTNPIIITLAVALDIGKLVVVSLLYKYWNELNNIMRGYALIASAVTMIITSAGAGAYLSGEFQKAIIGTQEVSLKVQVLKDQQLKYEERKKQIDQQIASLPEKTTVNQRLRLMNGFKAEQQELQNKITQIDKELPDLQVKQITVEAKAGPILYIAKAFDIPVESAVKWVILLIIFVFDPLAVFLIISGNFLLDQRSKKQVISVINHSNNIPNKETIIAMKESDELVRAHHERHNDTIELLADPIESNLEHKLQQFDPIKHGGEFPVETPYVEARDLDTEIQQVEAEELIEEVLIDEEPIEDTKVTPQVEREQITLDQLHNPSLPHASLGDVKIDGSVIFDTNSPPSTAITKAYKNL